MAIPDPAPFSVTPLEKKRGLAAGEPKSRYKMSIILNDHSVWVEALGDFLKRKENRIVFIIGNHDMELHWPSVQMDVIQAITRDPEMQSRTDSVNGSTSAIKTLSWNTVISTTIIVFVITPFIL